MKYLEYTSIYEYAQQVSREKDERIKMLEAMITNGLGWRDMENDVKYPDEI